MYRNCISKSLLKKWNTIISTFTTKIAHFALLFKNSDYCPWNSNVEKYLQGLMAK